MKTKVAIQTLGCKLNFAESSYLASKMKEGEVEIVSHPKNADLFILHSCTVTAVAESKCRAALRKAKKENPALQIAVIGCYAEKGAETLLKMPEVDAVFGNNQKYDVIDLVKNGHPLSEHDAFVPVSKTKEFLPAFSSTDRTRVFLKVQDGCDHYCTYCIIPFARGRSRSDTVANTVIQARKSLELGAKEIVLTGVNIGDFGKQHHENLFDLIKALLEIKELKRLRISSIEPELLTDEIIELAAKSDIIQPHFHLPLQGGTDQLLSAMKRKYNTETYRKRVEKIQKELPHACIAMDIIAGFPTETQEDIAQTETFIRALGVSYLHVFTYSQREGTKANEMPQVDVGVRRQRSRELHQLSEELKEKFYRSNIGRTEKVLFETRHSDGYLHGWTGNYIPVRTLRTDISVNSIVEVELINYDNDKMIFTI